MADFHIVQGKLEQPTLIKRIKILRKKLEMKLTFTWPVTDDFYVSFLLTETR